MSWGCIGEECGVVSEVGPGKCPCGADLVEQIQPRIEELAGLARRAARTYGHSAALAAGVAGEIATRQGDDLIACFETALENAAIYLCLAYAYQERQRDAAAQEMH